MVNASQPGVYSISNTKNGKIYIGSSVDMAARWGVHRHQLRKGEHHSVKLQRAWNKYGEEVFKFCVLEVVLDKNKLTSCEQAWMDKLHAVHKGYNVKPFAGSNIGYTPTLASRMKMSKSRTGMKRTLESRRKQSEAMRGVALSKNHSAKLAAINRERGAATEKTIATCSLCESKFETFPSELLRGRKYCSKKCYLEHRRIEAAPGKKEKEANSHCLNCGAGFYASPSEQKKGGGKYCTPECYHLAPKRTRRSRLIEYRGETVTLNELSRITGVPVSTLHYRLKTGKSVAEHDVVFKAWDESTEPETG